jgi:5-methyltetrahydrofolate--homocysteine methyltransferase
MIKQKILETIKNRPLIIDGAMGTQLQNFDIPSSAWLDENKIDQEGCNELLNATAPDILTKIHQQYAIAGAI